MREIRFMAYVPSIDKMSLQPFTLTDIAYNGGDTYASQIEEYEEEIIFMQYTGFKDKHGFDIYNDYIIEYDNTKYRYIVTFDEVRGMRMKAPIDSKMGNYEPLGTVAIREGGFTIIGNKRKNPELIKNV